MSATDKVLLERKVKTTNTDIAQSDANDAEPDDVEEEWIAAHESRYGKPSSKPNASTRKSSLAKSAIAKTSDTAGDQVKTGQMCNPSGIQFI